MLRIKENSLDKEYERVIEGMGKGLVLLKLQAKGNRSGYNNHLLYPNGRKPPLDIALHPEQGTIEYISFFLQDEKLQPTCAVNQIVLLDKSVTIVCTEFTATCYEKEEPINFKVMLTEEGILLVRENYSGKLLGYCLGSINYVLLDDDETIAGILLKDISVEEMKQLSESEVL